jgi:hypothetical protein
MIRAPLAALLVSTALSSAAYAVDLPATPANVWTVVNGAVGADRVLLASGAYDLRLMPIRLTPTDTSASVSFIGATAPSKRGR